MIHVKLLFNLEFNSSIIYFKKVSNFILFMHNKKSFKILFNYTTIFEILHQSNNIINKSV